MYKVGDKFILESDNGHEYDITVVNVNECREPCMIYACDVVMDKKFPFRDVQFCGDDFLNKCKKVSE